MYVCMYMYVCIYVYVYMYAGLEIGGFASQDANQFWSNCESLWLSESQNCESLLADLRISFQMASQKDLFWSSPFI